MLIESIRERLGEDGGKCGLYVTASTGAAAVNISGTTIHSFAGIGVGEEPAATIANKLKKRKGGNWRECRVLIIDEVSMLSAPIFDLIEQVARMMKQNSRPFGGIQVVLTGDFLQLPPVNKRGPSEYCFDAKGWPKVVGDNVFELTHVHRQSDQMFVRVLNAIRLGHLTPEAERLLHESVNRRLPPGALPVKLYSFRRDVDRDNSVELNKLSVPPHVVVSMDTGAQAQRRMLEHCPAPHELVLKVGSQVMLLKNIAVDEGLCNGSTGVVKEIRARPDDRGRSQVVGGYPVVVVTFNNGTTRPITPEDWSVGLGGSRASAKRRQIPLTLSWAMTIHKCQGSTLDNVELDLGDSFEAGQAYVALSRVRSVQGLKLLRWRPASVFCNPRAKTWYENIRTEEPTVLGDTDTSQTQLDTDADVTIDVDEDVKPVVVQQQQYRQMPQQQTRQHQQYQPQQQQINQQQTQFQRHMQPQQFQRQQQPQPQPVHQLQHQPPPQRQQPHQLQQMPVQMQPPTRQHPPQMAHPHPLVSQPVYPAMMQQVQGQIQVRHGHPSHPTQPSMPVTQPTRRAPTPTPTFEAKRPAPALPPAVSAFMAAHLPHMMHDGVPRGDPSTDAVVRDLVGLTQTHWHGPGSIVSRTEDGPGSTPTPAPNPRRQGRRHTMDMYRSFLK